MKRNVSSKLWSLFGVFVLVAAFLFLSYLVQSNIDFFKVMIMDSIWGLAIYVFLNFLGIVVAPITVIPLIVVVTGMWGPVVAAVSTLIAWVIGSAVAFFIGRKLGVPIVRRFISIKDLYRFEERFSLIRTFWGVVFLRMVIPVEILSYGLGLFSRIGFWKYIAASFVGLIPIAFLLGYLGVVPFIYQVVFALIVFICILIFMIAFELFGN